MSIWNMSEHFGTSYLEPPTEITQLKDMHALGPGRHLTRWHRPPGTHPCPVFETEVVGALPGFA